MFKDIGIKEEKWVISIGRDIVCDKKPTPKQSEKIYKLVEELFEKIETILGEENAQDNS